jgi:hypothetical protein
MRSLLSAFVVFSLGVSGFAAESKPAPEVAALSAALAGNDLTEKKAAIRAVASKSVGKDADVFPLLIGAISDRQAGEAAVSALSSRAGETPKDGTYKNNLELTIKAWQGWYESWQKKQAIKALEKKVDKKSEAIAATPASAISATPETAATEKSVPPQPAEDLGKIDRISFKSGGSLLCYIQSKRTDADGNLLSVRVIHPDGSGEETISADLISRIEEDLR